MATRSNLGQALTDFEDRVRQWTGGELEKDGRPPPSKACTCRVVYTLPAASTHSEICKLGIAKGTLDPQNLRERIEREITDQLGTNPAGVITIRAWEDGNASRGSIEISRVLVPHGDTGDMSTDLLKSLVFKFSTEHTQILQTMQLHSNSVMSMHAQTTQALAEVVAVKATAQSANEFGGVWGVVGLVMLTVGYPLAQKALKLPKGSTFADTVEAMRIEVNKAIGSEEGPGLDSLSPPPPGAGQETPPLLTEQAVDVDGGGNGKAPASAATVALLDKLLGDPDSGGPMLAVLLKDDAIRLRLKIALRESGVDLAAMLPPELAKQLLPQPEPAK